MGAALRNQGARLRIPSPARALRGLLSRSDAEGCRFYKC